MRRMASLRWIVVVVALVALAMAGSLAVRAAGAPAEVEARPSLDDVVSRTRAAGSARLEATLTPRAGGLGVELSGVTSLVSPAASVVATAAGRSAEVRVTEDGAWVRVGPDGPWTAVDPAAAQVAASAKGWGDLLGSLRPAPEAAPHDRRRLRATHDGDPVTLTADRQGRITRIELESSAGLLDVRFSDFGTPVDVETPPPP